MANPSDNELNITAQLRNKLSIIVVCIVLALITVLSITAITIGIYNTNQNLKFENTKDILNIILPLLATWIGTVLAFYYSQKNMDAATQQTNQIIKHLTSDQKLSEINAVDTGINMSNSDVTTLILSTPEDAASINLLKHVLEDKLEKTGRNRLPIIDSNGIVLYIVHRSAIDQFIISKHKNDNSNIQEYTLNDLLNDEKWKIIFQSFGTICKEDKLYAAKKAMDANLYCEDVFVTDDGTRSSKALYWLTNITIEQRSIV